MPETTSAVDDELYREMLLDHYRHPRHRGAVGGATATAHGHNPLCGDEVDVSLKVSGRVVEDIGFEGQGCSISMASASIMTEEVQGKPVSEVRELISRFRGLLVEGKDPSELGELGDLEALTGVRKYVARVKCAMLPWVALEDGLKAAEQVEQQVEQKVG
ncbi:MAG: SUF system NifU family Fe-S cluster assembly protein [Candidatus Dormiibacterota bacterium]